MSLRHRLTRPAVLFLAVLSTPITLSSAAEYLRAPIIPRPLDPVGFGSGETRDLVVKDLDGDNHLDLFAVSDNAAGVYWGTGSTRMSGPTTAFAGYTYYQRRPVGGDVGWLQDGVTFGAAVASDSVYVDINEDTHYFAPELRLFARTSARTFIPGRSLPLPGRATDVVLTDLDGDDWADAVVVTYFNASPGLIVFADVAAPAPGPVTPITTPGVISSVVAKDITGDGFVDLVAVEVSANHGFYLPGDGAGGFGARVDFDAETFGQLIDVADFDGQHGPDLFFRGFGFGQYVQLADGATFALPAETIENGGVLTEWGVVADVDEDGKLDVVSQLNQPRLLAVHRGDGLGGFADALGKIPTNGTGRLAVGDLDEDGNLDLVSRTDPGTVLVHPGHGDGTFGSPVSESPAGAHSLRLADLDGDGALDAISAGEFHFLAVQHGLGDGTFGAAEIAALPGDGWDVEIGTFDGDQYPDLFVVSKGDPSKLYVYAGGPGPLPVPVVVTLGTLTTTIALADVDGDGDDDVLFPDFQNPSYGVRTLLNNAGTLTPVAFIAVPNATAFAVGRLDGDATLDVAVSTGTGVRTLKGNGDGSFTLGPLSAAIPFVLGLDVLKLADLDGDHDNDLVVSARWENLYLFFGDGTGNLAGPVTVTPPIPGYAIPTFTLLDADRDGDTDVFIAQNYDRTGAVLPNRGDGTFDPGVIYGIGWEPMVMDAGDVNGDGGKDVVVGTRGGTPTLTVSLLSTNLALVGVDPTPPQARGAALALGRAWPNPSHGAFDVELTTAEAAPVELSIVSLSGRRIGAPMVAHPGARRVHVEPAERLSPGVYWLIATQGSARASGKAVVLP